MVTPRYVPGKFGVPFVEAVELPNISVTSADYTTWTTMPVYTTQWLAMHLVVDNYCTVEFTTDFLDPHYDRVFTVGPGAITVYFLVKGVPLYVSTSRGSHMLTIKAKAMLTGQTCQAAGKLHLHGLRGA